MFHLFICLKKDTNSHFHAQLNKCSCRTWLMVFWRWRGEERAYRQHAGRADKDKLRDPSAGHCGGNVPIHIIDKRISDLFIKPTARRETESLSRRCRRTLSGKSITPKWCKYEWSPEGLVRMTARALHGKESVARASHSQPRRRRLHKPSFRGARMRGVGGRSGGYSSHHYRCHHLLGSVCTSSHTSES